MPSVRIFQKDKPGTFKPLRTIVLHDAKAGRRPSKVMYRRRCKIRIRCWYPDIHSRF